MEWGSAPPIWVRSDGVVEKWSEAKNTNPVGVTRLQHESPTTPILLFVFRRPMISNCRAPGKTRTTPIRAPPKNKRIIWCAPVPIHRPQLRGFIWWTVGRSFRAVQDRAGNPSRGSHKQHRRSHPLIHAGAANHRSSPASGGEVGCRRRR